MANQEAHVADSSKNGSTLCAITHFPTIVSKCQMQQIFFISLTPCLQITNRKKSKELGVNLNAANQALLNSGTDTESFYKTSEEESYYSSVASSPSDSFHPPKSTHRSYLLSEKEDAKNHQYDLRSLDKFKTPQSDNRKSSVHFKMPSSNESKFTSPILRRHRVVSSGSRNRRISRQCSTSCRSGLMTSRKRPLRRALWLQASPASLKRPPILAVILPLKTVLANFRSRRSSILTSLNVPETLMPTSSKE